MSIRIEKSSFRDRDGFIFYKDEQVYRAILPSYKDTWQRLQNADFFKELIRERRLIGFELQSQNNDVPNAAAVLKVEKIPFISYPSEWTFGQLKQAALLTLQIQKKALEADFTLKDASAYNVQFLGPKPVFIDSLSFTGYTDGEPWQAYKQFCQHFLGPLLLWHYGVNEASSLFVNHIDGIPLKLSSKLLPVRSRFNLLAYTHIHLHAKFENSHAAKTATDQAKLRISKARVMSLLQHLEQGINNLSVRKKQTNWTDYYDTCSYTENGYAAKKAFVEKHLSALKGDLCVDLGANTGGFSELAAKCFNYVVACDNDVEVVTELRKKKTDRVLPLHIDLTNPTPAFGWANSERSSFVERIKKNDLVLALALIHHLCIGNNVPLQQLADFFAGCCQHLIIEFIPRSDVQIKKLLVTKKDIFDDYSIENFKAAFTSHFQIVDHARIPDSEREIFVLKKPSSV